MSRRLNSRRRSLAKCCLPLGLAVVLAIPASAAADVFGSLEETAIAPAGPTITSDREDYAPGELVTLTGAGWQPGEQVRIVVVDDAAIPELPWQREATVTADEAGAIVDEFNIADWMVAEYFVTAIGEFSGTAYTTFTDSHTERGCGTAATLVVNTTTDEFGTSNGVCSLREAIDAANAHNTITTITLPAGAYGLTRTGLEDNNASGDLDVKNFALTINGADARTTAVAGAWTSPHDRIFDVTSSGGITLKNMTVRNGHATESTSKEGGGIRVVSSSRTHLLDHVAVVGNSAAGQGGGIWNDSGAGTFTIKESLIGGNTASGTGDKNGGGIWSKGQMVLTNVTITNNQAAARGGGFWVDSSYATTMTNVTISHNHASTTGGGGGTHRKNGSVTLRNTIVANNSAGGTPALNNCADENTSQPAVTNGTNNLEGPGPTGATTCDFGTANNSQSNADPKLGGLQDNGGQTDTRALGTDAPASKAIDTATSTSAPTIDQRDAARPQDGDGNGSAINDIGAYEGAAPAVPNEASFTVTKDFSDGSAGSVTVVLDCSDDSFDGSKSASESAPAVFDLSGFEDGVESCSVTEDPVPSGYAESYDGDCEDVSVESDGDYTCDVTNTLNSTTIAAAKSYSDANTDPVSVTLSCTGGTIVGDNPQDASPGSPAQWTIEGYDSGATCSASENPVPAGYAQNNADCQNMALGTKTSCTIQNVEELVLVTRGSCSFDDVADRSKRQFPLIYTPDGSASYHKLTATNPGQFFMNAAYSGSASRMYVQVPYPFVTVGTNPVKVHDGVRWFTNGAGKQCYAPSGSLIRSQNDQVTWDWSTDNFGTTKTIPVDVPSSGFAYARIHLAYGLRGVAGTCSKGTTDPEVTCMNPVSRSWLTFQPYGFSFTGDSSTSSETVESYNVFKRNPGIGGSATVTGAGDPVAGVQADVYQGSKKVGTVHTDAHGWYMWTYKYTGKATTFTVKLPAYGLSQSATLKSNGYLNLNFNLPDSEPLPIDPGGSTDGGGTTEPAPTEPTPTEPKGGGKKK